MRILLSIILFIFSCKLGICQTNEQPPQKIVAKFDSLFPNAKYKDWYKKKTTVIWYVSFNCNCAEGYSSMVIDTSGNTWSIKRFLPIKKAPEKIYEYVKKHWGKYKLKEKIVEEYRDNKGKITYEVDEHTGDDMDSYQWMFNEAGDFISEVVISGCCE